MLFHGGGGASDIERRLERVRLAVAEHVFGLARRAGFVSLVAITADEEARRTLDGLGVEVRAPVTEPFHLGVELRTLVEERRLERVCSIGSGAGALLGLEDLARVREALATSEALVFSNNYYSADLVAVTPASALAAIDPPASDNPLPRLLHMQAGLPSQELPRSARSVFDVDTPTDATILLRHPRCPTPVRRVGAWEAEQGARIDAVLRLFVTPEVEVCVAGRVGAPVWAYLETQTACRMRILSEERGMQAAGRDRDGAARSALGYLYEQLGPRAFFERMATLGDGLVLDSRVLFAHLGLRPSAADRFLSDVFAHDDIADARVAEFTRAAGEAPIPVLLGGHTVVSGGLWALAEMAWPESRR